jgi:hypothetical protein
MVVNLQQCQVSHSIQNQIVGYMVKGFSKNYGLTYELFSCLYERTDGTRKTVLRTVKD